MRRSLLVCGALLVLSVALIPMRVQGAPDVSYYLSWQEPNSHYFDVRMELDDPGGDVVDVRIPAWRPGRYILQDYAKHVVGFTAEDGAGRPLPFRKVDKGTWRIQAGPAGKVVVRYQSYARQLDAGASYLDETEAYINPITLLMYVPGRELAPVALTLDKPAGWKVATALPFDEQQGAYVSDSYHDLVDAPLLISSSFETLAFDHAGARFELVFQGEGNYDPEKVVEDVRAIVATQIDIMKVVPFDRYLFLYHLLPYPFGHGVEHKNSTSIVMGPADFENDRFYNGFLGITAHEFFHAWLVERIRPEAIYHPDYSQEAYTTTMWIYEGITSYYTPLTMVRGGLISQEQYLGRLAGTFQGYDDQPGRAVTSVAMTSWDSWTKSSDAPPGTYYSFYTAGSVLGALLDLEVRGRTENRESLDSVLRYLYDTYAAQDRGVPEDGMEQALQAVTGTSFQPFFDAYVYGTETIDYDAFLQHAGLTLKKSEDPSRPAVSLGVNLSNEGDAPKITSVEPGTPAFEAGLDIDDVLVAAGGKRLTRDNLSDLLQDYQPGDTMALTFFRRDALRTAQVTLAGGANIRYEVVPVDDPTALQEQIRADWLGQ